MNSRKAESLFREYLSSPDPQVRKNALTALASAKLSGSYRDILQATMSDPDPGVRLRGEEEIAASGPLLAPEYADPLRSLVESRAHALDAYRLAGRIRARGAVAPLRLSLRRRILLAMRERASPEHRVHGLSKSAFLGSLAALVPFLVWITASLDRTVAPDVGAWSILGNLIAAWFIILVSGRWLRPLQVAASPTAALLVEATLLAGWGAALAGIGCLIASNAPFNISLSPGDVVGALLTGAVTLFAVRVAAAIAYGWSERPWPSRLIETLAGIAAGVLVLTAMSFRSPSSRLGSILWVLLPAILPGIASAVARADAEASTIAPIRRVFPRVGRPLTLVFIGLFVVEAVLPFVPRGTLALLASRQPATGDRVTTRGDETIRHVALTKLPHAEAFAVEEPVRVRIAVPDEAAGVGDFKIDFKVVGSEQALHSADDPPEISQVVQPGSYEIAVSTAGTVNLDYIFPRIVDRVTNRFRPVGGADSTASLEIEQRPLTAEEASEERAKPGSPDVLIARNPDSPAGAVTALDPRLRVVIERARDAQRRAHEAARQARALEEQIDSGSPREPATGLGISSGTEKSLGDRYEGQFERGLENGLGVFRFGVNPDNTTTSVRYDGQFVNGRREGVGVYLWQSGAMFAGSWKDGFRVGYGVEINADGSRYEGEWVESRREGHGVLWTADGQIKEAGIWTDSKLTTNLAAGGR
jgi:hypothetical protein